ncbi:hypothetical protein F4009_21450 [Candidatus Poribacteria bacterium]|nr:hypothetical protein [Candidatus Poribacteria bacterium]MYH80976.1 hypothetical protein [Candidatus Poribacteria bacterium]MYK96524.1 hypothetical protein [Candidatus Poribacteria bacterium]
MSGRTDDASVCWLGTLNKVRKIATALLDQQLWCWGQDIRRADGNALLAYGFTKHQPPEGKHGSTAYEWRSSGRSRVILWGFGFFYGDGDRGGLFLQRYKFAPKQTAAVDFSLPIWKSEQIPELTHPCDMEAWDRVFNLLTQGLAWIGDYEQWIISEYGLDYRQRCTDAWKKKKRIPAHEMAAKWHELVEYLLSQPKSN